MKNSDNTNSNESIDQNGVDPFDICENSNSPLPSFTEEELNEAIDVANEANWAAAKKFEALQYTSKMEFAQFYFPFP